MLPRFPAGKGTQEIGSKRKGKQGKEEFLKGKCNQGTGTMARTLDKGVKTGSNRRNANERSGRDRGGKLTAYVYSLHVFG